MRYRYDLNGLIESDDVLSADVLNSIAEAASRRAEVLTYSAQVYAGPIEVDVEGTPLELPGWGAALWRLATRLQELAWTYRAPRRRA